MNGTLRVASLLFVAACAARTPDSAAPRTPADSAGDTVLVIEVAPQLAPCTGVAPMQCLQVRFDTTGPWALFYSPIEGFTFEAGYQWRLEVERRTVTNPPADGSRYVWRLRRVLRALRDSA